MHSFVEKYVGIVCYIASHSFTILRIALHYMCYITCGNNRLHNITLHYIIPHYIQCGNSKYNNAITDGGVAPPTILLTIVMMSSNLKSLRISRNSKYSSRIVGSAQSAFAPAALRSSFAPAALRLILIIDL